MISCQSIGVPLCGACTGLPRGRFECWIAGYDHKIQTLPLNELAHYFSQLHMYDKWVEYFDYALARHSDVKTKLDKLMLLI